MTAEEVFKQYSSEKLTQLDERIATCLDQLTPAQIWTRNSDNENAIGNLVLHLCGNVRQWIGSRVAGQPDIRARDREFSARDGAAPPELKQRLLAVVSESAEIIAGLSRERLAETITVQGYTMTVLEAIYHVVEHFSGHTGQIIFATKLWTGSDLGFYRHLKQAAHSEQVP